ncbi:MAG: histidinol-phosphate transaminase [Chloroflexi bacterium]|nr:histidinol-phosphate transaminase [Chloroflexota bacterium]
MMQGYGIESAIRADLRDVKPYAAVEPPERLAEKAGIPRDRVLKLDANENPYGCSPRVPEALARYDRYHIYPDAICAESRELISRYVGVEAERVVVGNGSDEIIDLVFRLFVNPGEDIISCPPTFGYYSSSAASCGGTLRNVERGSAYQIDVPGILARMDERVKVIVIASPNNPSGNLIARDDLIELLSTGVPVLVDEAYAEFSGQSFIPLSANYDNLIVARTFSKWAGLAGLRIGYGIFPRTLVDYILKIKPPYNVNVAAQAAVNASLRDVDYLRDKVRTIVSEKNRLASELKEISFLSPHPSEANFILCVLTRGELGAIRAILEGHGIFFRYYDDPGLRNCLRISVGTPDQNDRVLATLREIDERV